MKEIRNFFSDLKSDLLAKGKDEARAVPLEAEVIRIAPQSPEPKGPPNVELSRKIHAFTMELVEQLTGTPPRRALVWLTGKRVEFAHVEVVARGLDLVTALYQRAVAMGQAAIELEQLDLLREAKEAELKDRPQLVKHNQDTRAEELRTKKLANDAAEAAYKRETREKPESEFGKFFKTGPQPSKDDERS